MADDRSRLGGGVPAALTWVVESVAAVLPAGDVERREVLDGVGRRAAASREAAVRRDERRDDARIIRRQVRVRAPVIGAGACLRRGGSQDPVIECLGHLVLLVA